MKEIKNIEIIGRGNVATHLAKAMNNHRVRLINPHTLENLDLNADLILISVKDDAIREVFSKIGDTKAIVAHTSGTTPINVVQREGIRSGVFYPLQTFSKDVPLDYSQIPFFVEALEQSTEEELRQLASTISEKVYTADSERRKVLHIASIFACNFANHLWGATNQILSDNGIPFSVVIPLVEETFRKASASGDPYTVQTGPAVRGDNNILENHLKMLESYPDLHSLYKTISESIQNKAKQCQE